jgi:hypothetical protein
MFVYNSKSTINVVNPIPSHVAINGLCTYDNPVWIMPLIPSNGIILGTRINVSPTVVSGTVQNVDISSMTNPE